MKHIAKWRMKQSHTLKLQLQGSSKDYAQDVLAWVWLLWRKLGDKVLIIV